MSDQNPFAEGDPRPVDPKAEHRRETFWTTVILTSLAVAGGIALFAESF